MSVIQELPIELLTYALTFALAIHPCPSHILCVCKTWETIATPVLHKNIQFTRISQLDSLSNYLSSNGRGLPLAPYSVTFARTIGPKSFDVFNTIQRAFQAINLSNLEVVRVHVHPSHGAMDVFDALKLINPLVFEWVSLDSKHQMTTAGSAARSFVLACATRWTRLQRIKLTGLTGVYHSIFDAFDGAVQPGLTHLEIGQAAEVQPLSVISALARVPNLIEAKLVDVYIRNIGQNRLRMEDLRSAFEAWEKPTTLRKENENQLTWNDVIRKTKCLVQKQKLEGGDRGEAMEEN